MGTMAHYLVRAQPDHERLPDLREKLQSGDVERLSPFGAELDDALRRARLDPKDGSAVWEEEDYCSPPLKEERAAVLNEYFDDITTEEVPAEEGWERIEDLPSLWWNPAGDDDAL